MTRARIHINISFLLAVIALLSPSFLLSSCSSGDDGMNEPTPQDEQQEIRMNADVWQVMSGTRATTFDNASALQTEGAFTCAVYNANTTTAYISPVQVDWVTDKWVFSDGKHYWPASGNLDFFAYMPATKPGYVTTITNNIANNVPNPYFTCADLPRTLAPTDATKEFIWALTTGQNKTANASGVTMNFKHPFARIKFKLSAASGTNVTVNSISIPEISRDGTCTLSGTGSSAVSAWTNLSDSGTFTITGSPATDDDAVYLVIPNNYGSKTLTVNATWSEWSNVTKDISADVTFNWLAGYSYTYTLTLSKYALTVSTEKYTEQW